MAAVSLAADSGVRQANACLANLERGSYPNWMPPSPSNAADGGRSYPLAPRWPLYSPPSNDAHMSGMAAETARRRLSDSGCARVAGVSVTQRLYAQISSSPRVYASESAAAIACFRNGTFRKYWASITELPSLTRGPAAGGGREQMKSAVAATAVSVKEALAPKEP
eukprot:5020359-Pleurochrysis_carterae.AAC.1